MTDAPAETVTAIKGFGLDWSCRGFQYEPGKTYEHDGPVVRCQSGGFHAIEGHPLAVLGHYPPATSRYAEVVCGGQIDRSDEDSKLAAARITIGVEIHLHELAQRAVKWVFDRAKWADGPIATKANEAATASGLWGAATASGYQGAATASGCCGKARASVGGALFLAERSGGGAILAVWAGIAGRDGIKPDVFYTLRGGKPVEA